MAHRRAASSPTYPPVAALPRQGSWGPTGGQRARRRQRRLARGAARSDADVVSAAPSATGRPRPVRHPPRRHRVEQERAPHRHAPTCPLLPEGEDQARAAGELARTGARSRLVLTSPLQPGPRDLRARRATATRPRSTDDLPRVGLRRLRGHHHRRDPRDGPRLDGVGQRPAPAARPSTQVGGPRRPGDRPGPRRRRRRARCSPTATSCGPHRPLVRARPRSRAAASRSRRPRSASSAGSTSTPTSSSGTPASDTGPVGTLGTRGARTVRGHRLRRDRGGRRGHRDDGDDDAREPRRRSSASGC